ncbi:ATPase family protein associated with various cellular activities (AAA) [Kribbella sp. VKM Ac-2569]|uniref:ATP-binding protein n=1 Tax=Kribbella sp. VKM Ac-2569 TaxID=2512220 RepID=UPI00102C8661|nr:ATP-binding protein [Kribbella sp. VKM Ac-2569]RZT17536.1 ATPase family protein associated with various cellular activities (AAA) [Kribbella sp. VKM Ac-2569]
MSEVALLTAADTSADLTARVGRVARAVADVLDDRCTPESGARQASTFLRDWAETASAPAGLPLQTPLDRLVGSFDLSSEEQDMLILAGLPEEHEGLATTFRNLHPQGEPRPTVGLAALLLGGTPEDRAHLRHLLTSGPALRHRLLRVEGNGPFFERSIMIADELWSCLHGCDAWPAGIPRIVTQGPPPGLAAWLDGPDVRACVGAVRRDARALLVVPHEDGSVGVGRCEAIAAAAGSPAIAAVVVPDDSARIALVLAHAVARGAVPVIMVPDRRERQPTALALGDFPGPVLVTAAPGDLVPSPDRAIISVGSGPVPVASLRAAWSAALPWLDGQAAAMAARHPLDPTVTAQLALDLAVVDYDPDPSHVSGMVRSRTGVNLPSGALLTQPDIAWSQLVLPAESAAQLRAAVDRLEQQSTVLDDWGLRDRAQATRGVRVLLTGPPGTGKSVAAAALATAAGTDLMLVDVSRIVSKWLGETEKNLAATFEAAERTRAVLLLDEADALFGTRTEISDAHDRYANLETAYLLQRMERFEGLVVLTSNMRQNIDPAFIRRLDFVVDLPLPDLDGRLALWRRCLPDSVLADDLDVDCLAQLYPIPGGWIRNAAVAAAFGAAAGGQTITQQSLVDAVRREYQKASIPFPGQPPRRRDDDI